MRSLAESPMKKFRYLTLIFALATLGACAKEEPPRDVLATDDALARDLELANLDPNPEPELRDLPSRPTPPAPAPSAPVAQPKPRPAPQPAPAPAPKPAPRPAPAPTPAPTPAPPTVTSSGNRVETATSGAGSSEGAVTGTVSAGTVINLAAGQKVCTNTNAVGDRFTATLTHAITASNGVVIPVGATTVVEVGSLKRSEQSGDDMVIGLIIRSLTYNGKTYPLNGEITYADANKVRRSDSKDGAKVAAGAVLGAILGRVVSGKGDKGKGTVIGAAAGAAVGAGVAEHQSDYDACIPSGGKITLRLNQPLSVQSMASGASAPAQLPTVGDDGKI